MADVSLLFTGTFRCAYRRASRTLLTQYKQGSNTPMGDQPLYEIVRAGIMQRMHNGEWPAGTKIPTEPQLAQAFGVGIGTIRRAVEELVAERLLIRRARRGTVVAKFSDDHAFDLFFSFVDVKGEPIRVGARLLGFTRERATADLADILDIPRGASVAKVENLRLLGEQPVMLDKIWFPTARFPDLDAHSFGARRGSIYAFYQERHGVSVVRIAEELSGVPASADVAIALGIPTASPILQIERIAYTFQDRPIEFRQRFVNTSKCAYKNIRGLQD